MKAAITFRRLSPNDARSVVAAGGVLFASASKAAKTMNGNNNGKVRVATIAISNKHQSDIGNSVQA